MVILAKTKIKDALDKYPQLKEFLIKLSPKFEKINNKFVFNLVSKWATFSDIAKIGGISICDLLHQVNAEIGMEDELFKHAPNCIKDNISIDVKREKPKWIEQAKCIIVLNFVNRDDFYFTEIMKTLDNLKEKEVLKIVNSFYPAPIINMLKDEGYDIFVQKEDENFSVYINYKEKKELVINLKDFQLLQLKDIKKDRFNFLINIAKQLPSGHGFILKSKSIPDYIINLLAPFGFTFNIEKKEGNFYFITFYKNKEVSFSDKVPVVLQSATPVVYPILIRLLSSKRLNSLIYIKELKVWHETERHLGWIVNNKADISFSAVAAVSKLFTKNLDIKMKAITIWDNFYILTRGFKVNDFMQLKDKTIYMPLIKAAPPYQVTSFIIKKLGYNISDFKFGFLKGFTRPIDLVNMLLDGKIEVALLREPEASFALYRGKGNIYESIAYKQLWKDIFNGNGNLPNAGILFKGEFLRRYPDISKVFIEEIKSAISWTNENKDKSSELISEFLDIDKEEAKLFLSRVNFNFISSEKAIYDIRAYLKALSEGGYPVKDFDLVKDLFL